MCTTHNGLDTMSINKYMVYENTVSFLIFISHPYLTSRQ